MSPSKGAHAVRNVRESAERMPGGAMSGSIIMEAENGELWDRYVEGDGGSSFCHLWGWREVLESELGAECLYRLVVDGEGRCQGLLPLVRVRSRVLGHYLVSIPFLNYGGALGSAAARRELEGWAIEEAGRSGADLLELRGRGEADYLPELRAAERKVTVTLELPREAGVLWKAFPSKLRSQIRRPLKEGMRSEFGEEQVSPFYEVFSRNMRDLGTPTLPRSFFTALIRHFGERVVFGVVYSGDLPVAAGCGFIWRGEFEMTWASSLREYNSRAPNMLLYWSFMEEMIGRGVRVFNFGRCTPGGGTHRFKLQWGGRDEQLRWGQWSARGVAATPSPERRVFQLATAVWRRTPLAIANRVGPVLARRLP